MKNFDGFCPPEISREVNTKWDSLSYTFNLFHIKVSPLCLDNFFKPEIRKPWFTVKKYVRICACIF